MGCPSKGLGHLLSLTYLVEMANGVKQTTGGTLQRQVGFPNPRVELTSVFKHMLKEPGWPSSPFLHRRSNKSRHWKQNAASLPTTLRETASTSGHVESMARKRARCRQVEEIDENLVRPEKEIRWARVSTARDRGKCQ